MPLSDPSAPQMTDLRDETELELFDVNGLEPQEPMEQPEYPSNGLINGHRDNVEDAQDVASTIEPAQDEAIEPAVSTSTQDDTPLFFLEVDPNPTTILAIPSYDPVSNPPLGTSAYQHSDEEDIVFKPRTYRQPEPISVPMPSIVPIPVPSTTPYFPAAAYIDPRARTRRDKKAAKRDKGGRKKKGRRKQVVIEGSDIEWGSDGPPGEIFGVEGLDDGNQDEGEGEGDGDDVEVLRDYLEGTLLNAKTEQEERDEEMRQDEVESDEDSEVDRAMEKEVERLFGDGGTNGAAGITEAFQVGEDEKGDEGGGEDEGEGDDGDWESSSGSGDSSDLGNIKVALAEVGSDSDEDVEDEVDLFAGKDSWDETDWFIRSMEVRRLYLCTF